MLWSVMGLWAAISLEMHENLGLVIAALTGVFTVHSGYRTNVARNATPSEFQENDSSLGSSVT